MLEVKKFSSSAFHLFKRGFLNFFISVWFNTYTSFLIGVDSQKLLTYKEMSEPVQQKTHSSMQLADDSILAQILKILRKNVRDSESSMKYESTSEQTSQLIRSAMSKRHRVINQNF
jgi:hypothetical protein